MKRNFSKDRIKNSNEENGRPEEEKEVSHTKMEKRNIAKDKIQCNVETCPPT